MEIRVEGSVRIDSSFNVSVEGFDALSLTPAMIGDSGIVISADEVKLDLSRTSAIPEVLAAGLDESFIGIFIGEAKVRFPDSFPALAPAVSPRRSLAGASPAGSRRVTSTRRPSSSCGPTPSSSAFPSV